MTREEFESILEEAFLEGYNDAMNEIFEEDSSFDNIQTKHQILKNAMEKSRNGKLSLLEKNRAIGTAKALNKQDSDRADKYRKFIERNRYSNESYFDLEEEMNSYDESLGLDDKRELKDAFEMMKKKGMSKKGISLNARLNVAQRAAKVGYYNTDDKNPYISEKSANKYGAKFMDHLRKNPDDAKKFVQAKTRLNGGSYKRNLEKMKSEIGI